MAKKDKNIEWTTIKNLLNGQADALNEDNNLQHLDSAVMQKRFHITQKDIRIRTDGAIKFVDYLEQNYPDYSRVEIFAAISLSEGNNMYYPEELLDEEICPLSGMAIWVLDVARWNGHLEDVCYILNRIEYDELSQIDAPLIRAKGHYLYSDELLDTLYTILYAEKGDFTGKSLLGKYWLEIKKYIPEQEFEVVEQEAEKLIDLYAKCTIDCTIFYKEKTDQRNVALMYNPQYNPMEDEERMMLSKQFIELHTGISLRPSLQSLRQKIGYAFYKRLEPFYDAVYKNEIDLYGLCTAYCMKPTWGNFYSSLYFLPQLVFRTVFLLLPWNVSRLTPNMDDVRIDYTVKDAVDMGSYFSVFYPIYRHLSPDKGEEYLANFAQYYFLKNEQMLPYQDLENSMNDFSVFSEKLAEKFSYFDKCVALINRTNDLNWIGVDTNNSVPLEDEDEEEEIEEIEDIETEDETDEQERDFEAENALLKKEIEALRKTVYSQDKSYRNLERKYEHLKDEYDKCHRSMSELNEAIFNRDNAEEEATIEKTLEGKFPYNATKRTVVFGGHDTWLKTIKTLVKEATFVGKGYQFSVELIRNAEVVWIQPNALSHSEYYRIIDAVRIYNKPCHYFKFASALKCAEQFVEVDNE